MYVYIGVSETTCMEISSTIVFNSIAQHPTNDIGSGNGSVPSGNKAFPGPMVTKVHDITRS